jgi:hypothetical protein
VTIPNAEHFFEQAERLIAPVRPGATRQVDLRRAISSAYYAVFHGVLAAAADEFVGRTKRAALEYSLAYRSIDHRTLSPRSAEVAPACIGSGSLPLLIAPVFLPSFCSHRDRRERLR